jgi:trigger factor
MIENRINSIMNDIDMRLRYQGINIEKYCEIMGISQQEMREQYKERAEKDVKTQLVLEKIAKEEAIAPTDEEVEAEIAKLAERYKQPVEELRKHLNEDDIEYMRSNLAVSKTIDFLVENANIA